MRSSPQSGEAPDLLLFSSGRSSRIQPSTRVPVDPHRYTRFAERIQDSYTRLPLVA